MNILSKLMNKLKKNKKNKNIEVIKNEKYYTLIVNNSIISLNKNLNIIISEILTYLLDNNIKISRNDFYNILNCVNNDIFDIKINEECEIKIITNYFL